MGVEDVCSIRLDLGLGYHGRLYEMNDFKDDKNNTRLLLTSSTSFEPSLTLGLSEDRYHDVQPLSSFSSGSIKRERDPCGSEERVSSRASDEDEEGSGRKKLRLTKEQSSLLEESFKKHTTLNPRQKQALAKELNLRPRQVEVWFQNRRARTKLKQTEVDCEVLRKCCQNLTEENRRLHKELQELKALKLSSPHYMQLPASATLSMCPSCEKIGGGESSSKTQFSVSNKVHIYNSFNNPSAAC